MNTQLLSFPEAIFLLAIVSAVFSLWMLVDVLRRDFRDPNTKVVWVLVVLLCQGIGPLLYFLMGRQQGQIRSQGSEAPHPQNRI